MEKPIRVLHLTFSDQGGAGLAALAIVDGTKGADLDARILFFKDFLRDKPLRNFFFRSKDFLKTTIKKYSPALPSTPYEKVSGIGSMLTLTWSQLPTHDILHLHWISGIFRWEPFFKSIPKGFPIVWTMHDYFPATGGCHVPFTCVGYKSACQACPASPKQQKIQQIFEKKRHLLAEKNLTFVASSRPMLRFLEESPISANHLLRLINLWPVHSTTPKKVAPRVPGADFRLGFMASGIHRKNKGLALLMEALQDFPNVNLFIAGQGTLSPKLSTRVTLLGKLQSRSDFDDFFEKIDCLVIPSYYESFGLTALEAIERNVPILASDTGIHAELLENESFGLLFPRGDLPALKDCIQKAMARRYHFDSTEFMKEFKMRGLQGYKSLYRQLLGEN